MKKLLYNFLDWWKEAPLWQSVWFIPFVTFIFALAFVKNLITGEYKSNDYQSNQ